MATTKINHLKIKQLDEGKESESEFDFQASEIMNFNGDAISLKLTDSELGTNDRPIVYDGAGHFLLGRQYAINRTAKSSKIFYGVGDDTKNAPASWSEEYPSDASAKYLWVKTITSCDDGTDIESAPIAIAIGGGSKSEESGQNGANGIVQNAKAAKRIAEISEEPEQSKPSCIGMFSFRTITDISLCNEILARVFSDGIDTLDYLFAGCESKGDGTLAIPDFDSSLSSKGAFASSDIPSISFGDGSLDFSGVDSPFGNAVSVAVRDGKSLSISGICGKNGIRQGFGLDYSNVTAFRDEDISDEIFADSESDEWLPKNINASLNIESHKISKAIVDSLLDSDGEKSIYFDTYSVSSSGSADSASMNAIPSDDDSLQTARGIMQSMNEKENWNFIGRAYQKSEGKYDEVKFSRILRMESIDDSSNLARTFTIEADSFLSKESGKEIAVEVVDRDGDVIQPRISVSFSSLLGAVCASFTIPYSNKKEGDSEEPHLISDGTKVYANFYSDGTLVSTLPFNDSGTMQFGYVLV